MAGLLARARDGASRMVNTVSKAVGLTASDAPDEVLVGYRNKLNKMEQVITTLKTSYSTFASSSVNASGSAAALAETMAKFVSTSKAPAREGAARAFQAAATSNDAVVAKSYRELFGWEVLKVFDDLNGEIRKLKRDIRTVESTQNEVASLDSHVTAMRAAREKKKASGQSLTAEQSALLASEEEKLTNHRARAQNLRRGLDDAVRKCVEGRYETLDVCFYRALELHMDATRSAWQEAQTLQSHIDAYRRRVPRSTAPVGGLTSAVPTNGAHDYDSDIDDDDDEPHVSHSSHSHTHTSNGNGSTSGVKDTPAVVAVVSAPKSTGGVPKHPLKTPTPPTTAPAPLVVPVVTATPVVVTPAAVTPVIAVTPASPSPAPKNAAAPAKAPSDLMDFFGFGGTGGSNVQSSIGRSASPAPPSLAAPSHPLQTSVSADTGLAGLMGFEAPVVHSSPRPAVAQSTVQMEDFFATGASPKKPGVAAAVSLASPQAATPVRATSGGNAARTSQTSTTSSTSGAADDFMGFHFPTAGSAPPPSSSSSSASSSETKTAAAKRAPDNMDDLDPFAQGPTHLPSMVPKSEKKSLRQKADERKAAAVTAAKTGGAFAGQGDGVRVGNDGVDRQHGGDALLGATNKNTGDFPTAYSHPDLDPNAPRKVVNTAISDSSEVPRSEMTYEQKAKVEADIAERLAEMKADDDAKTKEQEEMRAISLALAPTLDGWEYSSPNVPRNMRTLLSTLHKILWDGVNWTPVSITDVMTEAQIKKQHRKALLVVHPDHAARETSLERRVRAERAFKALDAGMKRFLDEQARQPSRPGGY